MSRAGFGQQGFQDGPGRFLMIAMFGRSGGRTERLFEERDADALRAAHFLERGRRPRLALHHLGEQGQPDGDDLAFLGQAGHGLFEKLLLVLAQCRWRSPASLPKARPNAASTFSAWSRSKRSTAAEFWPSRSRTSNSRMNRVDRHPEIIPHHDDALHPAAVALPQGLHQFGVLFFLLGVQPLLELVEDDQHLLADGNALAPAQCRQRLFQTQVVGKAGQRFRRPFSRRASVSSAVAST